MKHKISVLLIFMLSQAIWAQDAWMQQSMSSAERLDTLTARVDQLTKEIFKSPGAADGTIDEKLITEYIGRVKNSAAEINGAIDTCNKIQYPNTEAGNNTAALIMAKINEASGAYRMCMLELQAANNKMQRRRQSEMIQGLVTDLLKLVISQYIPIIK